MCMLVGEILAVYSYFAGKFTLQGGKNVHCIFYLLLQRFHKPQNSCMLQIPPPPPLKYYDLLYSMLQILSLPPPQYYNLFIFYLFLFMIFAS